MPENITCRFSWGFSAAAFVAVLFHFPRWIVMPHGFADERVAVVMHKGNPVGIRAMFFVFGGDWLLRLFRLYLFIYLFM
jgi:hypothetical protein